MGARHDWKKGLRLMWTGLVVGILSQPWAPRPWPSSPLTIVLFIFNLRGRAERAGRTAEGLDQEHIHAIHRQLLDAATRHPRDRDELAERLRDWRY